MRKHSSWIAMLASGPLMAVVLASPVSAHHGWSDYQDTQFEITGTLEEQRPASAAAGGAASAATPAGTLKVDSVKMVSTTCP